MERNSKIPVRRFPRLKDYNYSQPGAYFVTICVQDRKHTLGNIDTGCMTLNPVGEIVQIAWNNLPQRFQNIDLDAYVVMPNHFHGIVMIKENYGEAGGVKMPAEPLGEIIRVFKARTAFYIHKSGIHDFRWQQKYWDSIIRNDQHLFEVRQYIANNPMQWTLDQLYTP